MDIYVGNLSYQLTEEEVANEFAKFGTVNSMKIISDRSTGRSKGFGFVEMPNDEETETAIKEMNGKELNGRPIKVNKAIKR